METRLNVAGNSIYPMLLMFPAGLLVTAAIFDLADLAGGPALLGTVGYWHVVAGLVGGVAAGIAGVVDLSATRYGSRARRTAVRYGLISLGVLLLFAVVLMVRMRDPNRAVSGGLFALEVATMAAGVVLARFGDRLAERAPAVLRRDAEPVDVAETVVLRRPGV